MPEHFLLQCLDRRRREPEIARGPDEFSLSLEVCDEIPKALEGDSEALCPIPAIRRLEVAGLGLGANPVGEGPGLRVQLDAMRDEANEVGFAHDPLGGPQAVERQFRDLARDVLGQAPTQGSPGHARAHGFGGVECLEGADEDFFEISDPRFGDP